MSAPRTHLRPSLDNLYDYLDDVSESTTSSVASGSAVALTSTTAADVTSISLAAGDYEITGVVGYLPAASTSITYKTGGSSSTSATIGALGSSFALSQAAVVPGAVGQLHAIPAFRISLTATTTIYLVAQATFTVSTLGAYGLISARLISKASA